MPFGDGTSEEVSSFLIISCNSNFWVLLFMSGCFLWMQKLRFELHIKRLFVSVLINDNDNFPLEKISSWDIDIFGLQSFQMN